MSRISLLLAFISSSLILPAQAEFISTWNTGISNESITLTINSNIGSATVKYDVDWGDGNSDIDVIGDISHSYITPGNHVVKISGSFPGLQANMPIGNESKLISIDQWGTIKWATMKDAFKDVSKLTITATDAPDLSLVTNSSRMFSNCIQLINGVGHWDVSNVENMSEMFAGCSQFNEDLSNWNVINVISMNEMFNGASSFDQSLGDWEIAGVVEMSDMLVNSGLSRHNYDSTIIGWANYASGQDDVQIGVELGVTGLNYCLAVPARQQLIDNYNWIFDGDIMMTCQSEAFITAWQIDDPAEPLTILTNNNFSYNYAIDWENDGIVDEVNITVDVSHIYAAAGTYDVAIYSNFPTPSFFSSSGSSSSENRKLMEIKQWGTIRWESFRNSFSGSQNMTYSAVDTPDLSSVTSLSNMFNRCSSFNGDIGNWNTGNITEMGSMFRLASSFNQPIGNWNTQNVTIMASMFFGATSFNQPIGEWDTQNVTSMLAMFNGASSFNQPLGDWNVQNVDDMGALLNGAISFDQSLGDWDISSVSLMDMMLTSSGLSLENYDSTLIGWSEKNVRPEVELGADGLSYCIGADARQSLITNHDWFITRDTEDCSGEQQCSSTEQNSYIGPDGGDWHTAINWSTGSIPALCDMVIIDMNKEVSLSADAVCHTLDISTGSSITVAGHEMTVGSVMSN